MRKAFKVLGIASIIIIVVISIITPDQYKIDW